MRRTLLMGVAALALMGCGAEESGPRLVMDATLPPITPSETRTSTPEVVAMVTSELVSPLQVVTVQADFIIVTPTLPPSKTPSETPTITTTPSISPTPSMTATDTATAPAYPTSILTPTTAPIVNPVPVVCDTLWPFIQPPPRSCPLTRPNSRPGVYQAFRTQAGQISYMLWVDHPPYGENAIDGDEVYILFWDGTWTWRLDEFVEDNSQPPPVGSPYKDPIIDSDPSRWGFQPVRGFGLLWRRSYHGNRADLYDRVGWAETEDEIPFNSLKFYREEYVPNPTIFISRPNGDVFGLFANGTWALFSNYAFSGMPTATASGWVPIPGN